LRSPGAAPRLSLSVPPPFPPPPGVSRYAHTDHWRHGSLTASASPAGGGGRRRRPAAAAGPLGAREDRVVHPRRRAVVASRSAPAARRSQPKRKISYLCRDTSQLLRCFSPAACSTFGIFAPTAYHSEDIWYSTGVLSQSVFLFKEAEEILILNLNVFAAKFVPILF